MSRWWRTGFSTQGHFRYKVNTIEVRSPRTEYISRPVIALLRVRRGCCCSFGLSLASLQFRVDACTRCDT